MVKAAEVASTSCVVSGLREAADTTDEADTAGEDRIRMHAGDLIVEEVTASEHVLVAELACLRRTSPGMFA